jgi:hypothetical protein
MADENGHKLNTGLSVEIEVTSTIEAGELAYVDGFLGMNVREIESGESGVLDIEPAQWDVILPTTLDLSKGDIIYVDVTDLTGHVPDDSAFSTTSGGSKVKWAKAMTDQDGTTGQVRILQLPQQG